MEMDGPKQEGPASSMSKVSSRYHSWKKLLKMESSSPHLAGPRIGSWSFHLQFVLQSIIILFLPLLAHPYIVRQFAIAFDYVPAPVVENVVSTMKTWNYSKGKAKNGTCLLTKQIKPRTHTPPPAPSAVLVPRFGHFMYSDLDQMCMFYAHILIWCMYDIIWYVCYAC